jgi:hypothetical protein
VDNGSHGIGLSVVFFLLGSQLRAMEVAVRWLTQVNSGDEFEASPCSADEGKG